MNMVLKFRLIVSLLVQCFLLSGTALLADPCPSDVDDNRVATMCTNNSAVENRTDGSIDIDSVALRIQEQQSGCVCDITVKFQVTKPTIFYLKSYNDLTTLAPTNVRCGLEIDVENITSPGNIVDTLDPITCLNANNKRSFTAPDKQIFKLTSRKTNDTVMYGYCLQIYRDSTTNATPVTLGITCYDPIVVTSTSATTEDQFSTRAQHSTESTNLKTNGCVTNDMQEITTEDTSASPETVPTSGSVQTNLEIQTDSNSAPEEGRLKLYIISVSSAGGCLIIIFILGFVVCKCRRKKSKHNSRTQNKHTADESEDNDSYGLTNNVLYVSSDIQETCIGNYSTVELETQSTENSQLGFESTCINSVSPKEENDVFLSETMKFKPALKPKPSNSEATICKGDETNAVEYAVVNKTPKLQVDHVTSANSSNEYAVVNKTWKI